MTASAGPVLTKLHDEFGDAVSFVTLYVREAHPGDHFPQPETFEQKRAQARAYKERDAIRWPVAVDDLDGSLHRRLDPKPNSAYIVGADGRVAFRALWSNDERVLRDALEGIVAAPAAVIGQSTSMVVPMLAGVGKMHETLDSSGPTAKRDVMLKAPPVFAMAALARLFRPLPPMWRTVAGMGLGAGVAIGITRAIRGGQPQAA
jgi:hypothetical protein